MPLTVWRRKQYPSLQKRLILDGEGGRLTEGKRTSWFLRVTNKWHHPHLTIKVGKVEI